MTTWMKLATGISLALLLSACDATDPQLADATREDAPRVFFAEPDAPIQTTYRVDAVRVYVDPDLQVSERNGYYPGGDIVWRGDPPGNRHKQVRDIFELAFARGTDGLRGNQGIELHVDVRRFHALTEKARYTTGGVHAITFVLQKRDTSTGAAVGPAKLIRADLEAFGGERALEAERLGQTQKVRITDHLARVIRAELTSPEGYTNARLGPIQALNQL